MSPIHPLLSILFATVLVLVIVLSFNYCGSFPFSSLHSVALIIFLKCKTVILLLCLRPIQWLLIALRVKYKLLNRGVKSFMIWPMLRLPFCALSILRSRFTERIQCASAISEPWHLLFLLLVPLSCLHPLSCPLCLPNSFWGFASHSTITASQETLLDSHTGLRIPSMCSIGPILLFFF